MIILAYQALYRSYRPSQFEQVAGQRHIVVTLENAVKENKIAHAYLFCGPRGTGKTTIARILAKMVNCTGEEVPCNECANCQAIQNGSHPDIIEIDAASNNGVDEVRDLIDKVKFAPSLGKYKVYIIDEVHMMSTGAFNALLKTLEEPPEHVIFIMATTEPQKILPTIISRCQRYDFGKISKVDIQNSLRKVAENEKIEIDDESLQLIATLADGGMRDALSIMDQCIAYARNHISIDVINEIYGITTVSEKIKLIEYVKQKDVSSLLALFHQYIDKGIDIKRLCMDLIEILKESIIYEYVNDGTYSLNLSKEEAMHLIELVSKEERFYMIDTLLECNEKFRFASDVADYFELCLLKMLQGKPQVVQPQIIYADKPKTTVETKKELPSKKQNSIAMNEIINLLVQADKQCRNEATAVFQRLSNYYLDDTYRTAAKWLSDCQIVAADGKTFILVATPYQGQADIINDETHIEDIVRFTKELFGNERMVYAISEDTRNKSISEFRVLASSNQLPNGKPITVLKIQEESKKQGNPNLEKIERLKEIAGDIFESAEED